MKLCFSVALLYCFLSLVYFGICDLQIYYIIQHFSDGENEDGNADEENEEILVKRRTKAKVKVEKCDQIHLTPSIREYVVK